MQQMTVTIKEKEGVILSPAFWRRLGVQAGEELVVQEIAPVVTIVPKRFVRVYGRTAQTLSASQLKKYGLEDQKAWRSDAQALRKIRQRLNREEYPALYA